MTTKIEAVICAECAEWPAVKTATGEAHYCEHNQVLALINTRDASGVFWNQIDKKNALEIINQQKQIANRENGLFN